MKTSCRTMMVGLIGLWLGGCSVVVFEDSAACPAQKTCPIDTIKVAPVPEGTELNALEQDDTAQNSTSADETASSASRQNGTTGQTALISPVDEADQIDGHLSYFDVDSAACGRQPLAGCCLLRNISKPIQTSAFLLKGIVTSVEHVTIILRLEKNVPRRFEGNW